MEVLSIAQDESGKGPRFSLQARHDQGRFHHHAFAEYTGFIKKLKRFQDYKPPLAPPHVLSAALFLVLTILALKLTVVNKVFLILAVVISTALYFLLFSAPNSTIEPIKARYVVNCAGLGSDKIAKMVGDDSFYIKPRIGEYLLLNKNQGDKCNKILFPCPGKMGKGILVQKTLWGNLILGPTAADVNDPSTASRTTAEVMKIILKGCRGLIPSFDSGEIIHSFAGARAKSSRGDWIIEPCGTAPGFIHAAGIDSPGLAGSPAIAKEVVKLLKEAGLKCVSDLNFNPNRKPIIVPKNNWSIWRNGKKESIKINAQDKKMDPALHVVCRCEKVTEAEIVDSIHRSLPVDSTQAVRKRTRAGMGHCQGEYCECRVKKILARELGKGNS